MRLTFLTVCMILLYNGFPGAARAQGNPCQDYPWCMETLERRTDCSFTTYEQCKWTASGIGGCFRNHRRAPCERVVLTLRQDCDVVAGAAQSAQLAAAGESDGER